MREIEMENERGMVHDDGRDGCIHHWLIDEKNFGVCKKCGASKQFLTGSWYDASIRKTAYNKSSKVQQGIPDSKN
jgi:hypothetical protein